MHQLLASDMQTRLGTY